MLRSLILLPVFLLLATTSVLPASAQRVGGPNMVYDNRNAIPAFAARQRSWATAGVIGGIRNPATRRRNVASGDNTAAIQRKIDSLSSDGGGVLRFPGGTFRITSTLRVKRNVVLEGAPNGSTTLRDALSTNNRRATGIVVLFENLNGGHRVGGLRNLTVRGPYDGNPRRADWNNRRLNGDNTSVAFRRSQNCFLDNVKIINSGSTAFTAFNSDGTGHHTLRNSLFRGAWNKGGGGEGYLNISAGFCLVTGCTIRDLRHFGIQGAGARFNVVYNNTIQQDVNFHNGDSGRNLIERNRITIDSGIANVNGTRRFAVMGPWSTMHRPSTQLNVIYNNTVSEAGRSNPRCADPARVYTGARGYEPNIRSTSNVFVPNGGNPFGQSQFIGRGRKLYSVRAR